MEKNKINQFLLLLTILIYVWSAINPYGYFIWFLETIPIAIGLILIFLTRNKFPLSNFLYRIILIHMIILAIGGHYTYAQVPLFNYIKEAFDLPRNDYDKIGHFFQGVTPALLTREIILRKTNLKNQFFILIFSISIALSFSALYEIFEWAMAILTNEGSDFVSMQGDVWDAQKDMLVALFGAVIIVTFFRKVHDDSLKTFGF